MNIYIYIYIYEHIDSCIDRYSRCELEPPLNRGRIPARADRGRVGYVPQLNLEQGFRVNPNPLTCKKKGCWLYTSTRILVKRPRRRCVPAPPPSRERKRAPAKIRMLVIYIQYINIYIYILV